GGGGNWIWSHRWSLWALPGGQWTSSDKNSNNVNIKVYDYHTEPALWGTSGTGIVRFGVIAHETGHFFGLPDLYDTVGSGEGIGSWELMANSWGFDGTQLHPPHFSAWSKIKLGWVTPTVISTPGYYAIGQAEMNPQVYRINYGYPSNEYLLIENRQPVGIESAMPQGGLCIYHIDDLAGYDTEGYPGQAGWPTNGDHYRVALLQADGNYNLEKGNNRGDRYDVYHAAGVSQIGTGPGIYPNTDAYQSGNIIVTNNTFHSISAAGASMSFVYDNGSVSQPPAAQTGSVSTQSNTFVPITLVATDDGLPNPPGALNYIITSLPTNGSLSDPGAGSIGTVPYTVAGNGDQVVYTPTTGYSGTDSFMFRANDGGVPPYGGDSNQATISVSVLSQGFTVFLTESFESPFVNYAPPGWSKTFKTGTVNWIRNAGDHLTDGSHGGAYNAMLYKRNASDHETYLITPAIHFAGGTQAATLEFWHKQAFWSPDQDTLTVYYKTGAGGSWTQLASYTAEVPDWTKRTLLLPNPSSDYYIGFLGNAKYGYGVCIDDVNVTGIIPLPQYTIAGAILSNGTGLDGITMTGLPGNPITSGGGLYSISVDYGWSGIVTPTKAGYTFTPGSITYSNVVENHPADNYTAALNRYVISGYVKNQCDIPISGVDVNNQGGSAITDANGYYEIGVDYNWAGAITPTKKEYTFEPNSISYDGVVGDVTNQDYVANNMYDLDGDCSIGMGDLAIVSQNWLAAGADVAGDFNRDEILDFLDLALFALHWHE
ncbi:MAG: choice-of-anchor J domain-containing protein, partial [Sedimentisphaerales bacterium]|nr:choice-of-anchor J domain-containing protein [Sedimentisphaerales bacterium]